MDGELCGIKVADAETWDEMERERRCLVASRIPKADVR